jgi:macrolide transport system ATP-binding/permease protein
MNDQKDIHSEKEPILEFSNICYSYENSSEQILKDISFNVFSGEYISIIGPSGSGKSTLLNLIGLLSFPNAGSLKICGKPVNNELSSSQSAILRNETLGFVFQSFMLLPKLTVTENILLPCQYQNKFSLADMEKKAFVLLKQLGIENFKDKYPNELSGGQKQRVAICRALILSPKIILADEPTGSLDSNTTTEVLQIFDSLVAQGQTVIVITHDANVAGRSERIISLSDGKVIEDKNNKPKKQIFSAQEKYSSQTNLNTTKLKALEFLKNTKYFLKQTAANLFSHKLRSLLTVFGLTIGVSSIVIMYSLITETKTVFRNFFSTKGGNQAFLMFDRRAAEKTGVPRWGGMMVGQETESFQDIFKDKVLVDPILEVESCLISSVHSQARASLRGINSPQILQKENLQSIQGRMFSLSDFATSTNPSKTIILGTELFRKIFPLGKLFEVGDRVTLSGCALSGSFSVIGILAEQDTTFDENANSLALMTLPTLLASGAPKKVSMFALTPLAKNISPTQAGEMVKNMLVLQTKNKFPFRFFAPEQQIKKIDSMLNLFSVLTVLIGILCTVIGGVGVMNIVLAGMTERLREIGLRKALGANDKNIRNQFLGETIALCIVAGVLGVLFGVLVSNVILGIAAGLFPKYLQHSFVFNLSAITLALSGALGTGFVFGLYPALKASQKEIISSLKME